MSASYNLDLKLATDSVDATTVRNDHDGEAPPSPKFTPTSPALPVMSKEVDLPAGAVSPNWYDQYASQVNPEIDLANMYVAVGKVEEKVDKAMSEKRQGREKG